MTNIYAYYDNSFDYAFEMAIEELEKENKKSIDK